jgi:hypothetical protein
VSGSRVPPPTPLLLTPPPPLLLPLHGAAADDAFIVLAAAEPATGAHPAKDGVERERGKTPTTPAPPRRPPATDEEEGVVNGAKGAALLRRLSAMSGEEEGLPPLWWQLRFGSSRMTSEQRKQENAWNEGGERKESRSKIKRTRRSCRPRLKHSKKREN